MEMISGIVVDVILFLIIAGNAALNYRRGFTRVVFNLFSGIIAIILVFILYKPVTNYIINHTNLTTKLENVLDENLAYLFEKDNIESPEQLQESSSMNAILNVFIGDELGNLLQETTDSVIQYMSIQMSHKVISVIVFFALFAIIRLLLYVFRTYIEMLANLPILRVFNGSIGMIYGVIRGFLIIYALFAIISLMMPIMQGTVILNAIQSAKIASKMFNNNIILNLIFKFI